MGEVIGPLEFPVEAGQPGKFPQRHRLEGGVVLLAGVIEQGLAGGPGPGRVAAEAKDARPPRLAERNLQPVSDFLGQSDSFGHRRLCLIEAFAAGQDASPGSGEHGVLPGRPRDPRLPQGGFQHGGRLVGSALGQLAEREQERHQRASEGRVAEPLGQLQGGFCMGTGLHQTAHPHVAPAGEGMVPRLHLAAGRVERRPSLVEVPGHEPMVVAVDGVDQQDQPAEDRRDRVAHVVAGRHRVVDEVLASHRVGHRLDDAVDHHRPGEVPAVVDGAGPFRHVLGETEGGVGPAVDHGQQPSGPHGPVPGRRAGHRRVGQHPVEPGRRLPQPAPGEPEMGEPDEDIHAPVGVLLAQSPLEGSAKVVVLGLEPGGERVVGEKPLLGLDRQPAEEGEMGVPYTARL